MKNGIFLPLKNPLPTKGWKSIYETLIFEKKFYGNTDKLTKYSILGSCMFVFYGTRSIECTKSKCHICSLYALNNMLFLSFLKNLKDYDFLT